MHVFVVNTYTNDYLNKLFQHENQLVLNTLSNLLLISNCKENAKKKKDSQKVKSS